MKFLQNQIMAMPSVVQSTRLKTFRISEEKLLFIMSSKYHSE